MFDILDDHFIDDELVHETSAAPGVDISAERLSSQYDLLCGPLGEGAGLGPHLARRAYERGVRLEVCYESKRAVDGKDRQRAEEAREVGVLGHDFQQFF